MRVSLEIEAGQETAIVQALSEAGHAWTASSLASALLSSCPEDAVDEAVDLLCRVCSRLEAWTPGRTVPLAQLAEKPERAAVFIARVGETSGSEGVARAMPLLHGSRAQQPLALLRLAQIGSALHMHDIAAHLARCLGPAIDARSYLEALRELRDLPAATAARLQPFHPALARALVAHPDHAVKVGALAQWVDSDAAIEAIVEATLDAGGNPIPWLDRQCSAGRWDLLLRLLRRLSARGWSTPDLPLREAEALEHLGDHLGADRLERLAADEIARHQDSISRAPTLSTMMFRNLPMLACIGELVRNAVARSVNRPVRVHVAAASTGEEAFSLALWLRAESLLDNVELLVTDVDATAVAKARTGQVSRRLSTRIPDRFQEQLHGEDREHLRIPKEVFERLEIRQFDLIAGPADGVPPADVIVLNNLTVHLSVEDRRRLVGALGSRVKDDGFVVMGGDDLAPILPVLGEQGFHPVLAGARACHEGWTIQRRAWYRLPRRYWALPPYRDDPTSPARYASIFCRDPQDIDVVAQAIMRLTLMP